MQIKNPNHVIVIDTDIELASIGSRRPSLLLQACCGPCTLGCIEFLKEHFDLSVLYYNPNIRPPEEWEKRLFWLKRVLEHFDVPLLDCEYDEESFLPVISGREDAPEGGARCRDCFSLRLSHTAEKAASLGFEYYCSTLTVSSRKPAGLINELGRQYALENNVRWLPSDFKKRGGNLRSTRLCEELGIYQQGWCGCTPS
ncbi:MAG: epoxyqueuosine reductase QueH [Oscillospiraceae bacterium]|nr:epoxyqueuosine reductase QueH [Oscillospiraceae bacterium]